MLKRSFATRLAAIAGAGLAIRLVYSLAVMGGRTPSGDGREFHLLANVLADTGRYLQPLMHIYRGRDIPTAEKPPLYPTVLALPSRLGLDSYAAHRVASCLLGAAAVALIGLLGRRVAGPRVGLIAAALAAVYPALWMLDASLRSESLYLPLIVLVALLAYRVLDSPSTGRTALLGAAIGLAALTRSEALVLVLLLAVPVLVGARPPRAPVAVAALLAGCLLVTGPWLARNWITFDRPTGISTNEGGLLAGANCHSAYYTALIGTWACFPRNDPRWGENEAVISGHLRGRAFDYAGDHAGRVPAVAGVRILRVWDLWSPADAARLESSVADRHLRAQQAAMAFLYALLPFAVAGAVVLRRRGERSWVLLVLPAFVTLVAAAAYGTTRFRVAAEPAIVVLAAVGVAALRDRLRSRRNARRGAEVQPA
jgi:4-amino-4-deoxy-L-arabinose transferase-like glycosyltransferase